MKKLIPFLILCLAGFTAQSQFVYKIKADSVLITNDSCSAELNLENSTKNVNGFLFNKGRGRTEFRKGLIKVNDSLYIIGGDTLNLYASSIPISTLTAALKNNTIDNRYYTQEWKWDSIPTNSVGLKISSNSQALGSKLIEFSNSGTGGNDAYVLHVKADRVSTGIAKLTGALLVSATNTTNTTANRAATFNVYKPFHGIEINSTGESLGTGIYLNHEGLNGMEVLVSGSWSSANHREAIFARTNGSTTTARNIGISALALNSSIGNHPILAEGGTSGFGLNAGSGNWPTSLVHIGASTSSTASLRINSGTAPSSPNDGDIWHASNHLYARLNGSTVQLDGQSASSWSLTGNAGTSPSTNFLGTTDDQELVFKTNNTEKMRIRGTGGGAYGGFVGIGTNAPTKLLHIYGANPTILVEGDSSSYFPALVLKPLAPFNSGTVNTYGPASSTYIGGLHISTSTPNGYSQLAATPYGVKSLSSDSMIITHQVIGTRGQSADIFDVAENTSSIAGMIIPGSFFAVKNSGKLVLSKYKNNVGEDSVLTTDDNGIVKLKSFASGIASNAWSLTGNASTNPSTNFLGTTDSKRLVFRTKNTEQATIDTTGNFMVGTSTDNGSRFNVLRAGTSLTAEGRVINASTQGATYNTTSSVLSSYGGYFSSNATRASGSNSLTNIGLFATASGGQVNIALKTDGAVNMTNLPTSTDTTSYKPLAVNSSGDVVKVTGWPPAVNYTVQSSLSDASGTITWNVANGINGSVTLSGTGRTLSITNPVAGMTYTIRIVQDGSGSRTITTWPTGSKWPSGTTPTLSTVAGRIDIVVFYYDGTNYYGTYQQHFQ